MPGKKKSSFEPNKYSYTSEKLYRAITTLAEHPGRIQERLYAAVMDMHTILGEGERFPPDTLDRMLRLEERVTAISDPRDGAFLASTRAMTDDDAVECARWIVETYFRVHALAKNDEWTGGERTPL